jgi:tetratricopeptide (TPR) repeat protein
MAVSTSAEIPEPVTGDHSPGVALRAYLQRADLSPEQFARRLSRLAAEQGLNRRLSDKTPYKWLRGSIPRQPWPALAVHELSSRLGTRLTAADLGWSEPGSAGPELLLADAGLDHPWTPDGALTALGRVSDLQAGMDRRFLPMRGTALTKLALDWLTADPAGDPARTEGRRVGVEQADDIEHITARLRRMDARHGGGLVLPLAQDYARNVTGILRRYSYPVSAGVRLWAAAADLHGLAGWLCHDTSRPALAQRHWIAGLRAAHAAGDRAVGAGILASLSVQASAAGQPAPALDLARAAQRGHPVASPRLSAVISFAAAHAHAAAGDASACHAAINAARQALAAANADVPEPAGAAWLDDAAASAQAGIACLYLREYDQAQKCLTAALRDFDPVARARDTAVTRARLGLGYASQHQPERACRSAAQAISTLTQAVDSPRCLGYLRDLREALRPHRRHPAVADLTSQTDVLLSEG